MSHLPTSPLAVMLADDHEIVLQGLRTLLNGASHIRVVGEARTGDEAVRLHQELQPDLTLLDIRMPPGMDGIATLAAIRQNSPKAKVIMFASDDFEVDLLRAWQLGAAGFLIKTVSRDELINAIDSVVTNGWCAPFKPGHLPVGAKGEGALSPREIEVLEYVKRGLSNADVAKALSITEHTIKAHLKMIFLKLGCADRTEAVMMALERGLIRLEPGHRNGMG